MSSDLNKQDISDLPVKLMMERMLLTEERNKLVAMKYCSNDENKNPELVNGYLVSVSH